MRECRCRQQAVDEWNGLRQAGPAPVVSHLFSHGQDAVSELSSESKQPMLKGPCLPGVAESNPLDAATDFSQRHDADEKLLSGGVFNPFAHTGITPALFAEFTLNI